MAYTKSQIEKFRNKVINEGYLGREDDEIDDDTSSGTHFTQSDIDYYRQQIIDRWDREGYPEESRNDFSKMSNDKSYDTSNNTLKSAEETYNYASDKLKNLSEDQKKALDTYNSANNLLTSQAAFNGMNGNSFGVFVGPESGMKQADKMQKAKADYNDASTFAQNLEYAQVKKDYEDRKARQEELKNVSAAELEVASVFNALMSPASQVLAFAGALDRPLDENLGLNTNNRNYFLQNLNTDTAQAMSDKINDEFGEDSIKSKVLNKLYEAQQAAISSVSSIAMGAGVSGALGLTGKVGELAAGAIGTAPFFGGGYASSIQKSQERGLTEDQAVELALASGALEWGTEIIPGALGARIFKGIGAKLGKEATEEIAEATTKELIKNIGKETASEMGEEAINDFGYAIADALITGDKSEYKTSVKDYMSQGMSEEEANKKAMTDFAYNVLSDMSTAAISSLATGGAAIATNSVFDHVSSKALDNNYNTVVESISDNKEDYKDEKYYELAQDIKEKASEYETSDVSSKDRTQMLRDLAILNEGANYDVLGKINETLASPTVNTQGAETYKNNLSESQVAQAMVKATNVSDFVEAYRDSQASVNPKTRQIGESYFNRLRGKFDNASYDNPVSQVDQALQQRSATDIYNAVLNGEEVSNNELNTAQKQKAYNMANRELENRNIQESIKQDSSKLQNIKADGQTIAFNKIKNDNGQIVIETKSGTKPISNLRVDDAASSRFLANMSKQPTAELSLAYAENYNGMPIGSYNTLVNATVRAGRLGIKSFDDFIKQNKMYVDAIGKESLQKFYDLGAKENKADTKNKKANSAKKKGTGKVTVSDDVKKNNEGLVSIASMLAKKTGVDFEIVDGGIAIDGTDVISNGQFQQSISKVVLGVNGKEFKTLMHEGLGEFLEAYNQEDMRDIQNSILSYLEEKGSDALDNTINSYKEAYEKGEGIKSYRDAANELVNDTLVGLFSTEEGLNDFVLWCNNNDKSILQKIKDFFTELVNKLKAIATNASRETKAVAEMAEKNARELRQQIFEAMDKAIENYNNIKVENTESDSKVAFSLDAPVEETNELIAVHNLRENNLLETIELGGFPMPSIAIMKAKDANSNENYGEISVIFGKDVIDPKANRNNKVYLGDAWTPTFPTIAYKVNENVQERIQDKVKKLIGTDALYELRAGLDYDNMEDKLNRDNGDYKAAYGRNEAIKYAYLKDSGSDFTPIMSEKEYNGKGGNGEIFTIVEYCKNHGVELPTSSDTTKSILDDLKNVLNAYWKKEFNIEEFYSDKNWGFGKADQLLYKASQMAYDIEKNGAIPKKLDYYATKDKINQLVDTENVDYNKWLDNLFSDVVENKGIRNNKDLFTPSGNRRSWNVLHDELTLENIVKNMRSGIQKGVGMMGMGSPFGAAAKDLESIDDIRAHKNQLKQLNKEEYDKIRSDFTDRFAEIASAYSKGDDFFAHTNAGEALCEYIAESKTKSGLISKMKKDAQFFNYSDFVADDLWELVKDIQTMPTGYFEAKPQRAVGLDEIKKVVLPSNSSEELLEKLDKNNIAYDTYEEGNTKDRLDKINSNEDVRFSIDADSYNEHPTDNDDVRYSIEVEYKNIKKAEKSIIHSEISRDIAYIRGVQKSDNHFDSFVTTFNYVAFYNYLGENDRYIYKILKNDDKLLFSEMIDFIIERRRMLDERDNRDPNRFDRFIARIRSEYGDYSWDNIRTGYQRKTISDDDLLSFMQTTFRSKNKTSNLSSGSEVLGNSETRNSIDEDSEGNKLTNDQVKYFAESKARDQEGRLVKLYHGANEAGFSEFDAITGKYWFTDNWYVSESYSGNSNDVNFEGYVDENNWLEDNENGAIYPVYLNLKNPLIVEDQEGRMFDEIRYNGRVWNTTDISDYAKEQGYDGIIIRNIMDVGEYEGNPMDDGLSDVYVAFNKNAIKLTTNEHPTDNNDIRYSIDEDSEGNKLTEDQVQKFGNSEARDEEGKLKIYYHGTENGGFNTFDNNDFATFFTDRQDIARGYSGNSEIYAPKTYRTLSALQEAYKDYPDITIKKEDGKYAAYDEDYDIDKSTDLNELNESIRGWLGLDGSLIYAVYLDATNPLVVDAKGSRWDELVPDNYSNILEDVRFERDDDGNYYASYWKDNNRVEEQYKTYDELLDKWTIDAFEFIQDGDARDFYLDENGSVIPRTTNGYIGYAKDKGYDSVIFNNIEDNGLYVEGKDKFSTSQVVAVFNENQIKSIANEHPTDSNDIRYSLAPALTQEDTVAFFGTEEEIAIDERETKARENFFKDIINAKDFNALELTNNVGHTVALTPSTRDYKWQITYWDDLGAIMHTNHETTDSAVKELMIETPREETEVKVYDGNNKDYRFSIDDDFNMFDAMYDESDSPFVGDWDEGSVFSEKPYEVAEGTKSILTGIIKGVKQNVDITLNDKKLDRVVEKVLNKYQSDYDKASDEIKMALEGLSRNNEDIDLDVNMLINAGSNIINNSKHVSKEDVENYESFKRELRQHKFSLTDSVLADVKSYYGDWTSAFGELSGFLDKNAKPLDSGTYSEIYGVALNHGYQMDYTANEGDQFLQIIEALQALEPTPINPYEGSIEEAGLSAAMSIMEEYFNELSNNIKDNAIKNAETPEGIKKRLDKEKQKLRQQAKEYKEAIQESYMKKEKEYKEQLKQAASDYQILQNNLKKIPSEALNNTAKHKAQNSDKLLSTYIERQEKNHQIEMIRRNGNALITWITKPTKNKYVPDVLKQPLLEMLESIEFVSHRAKPDSKGTLLWREKMIKVSNILGDIVNYNSDLDDLRNDTMRNTMARLSQTIDQNTKGTLDKFLKDTEGKKVVISQLDAEQLKQLNRAITAIKNGVSNANKLFANAIYEDVDALAENSLSEMSKLKSLKTTQGVKGKAHNFFNLAQLEPVSYFSELGNATKTLFNEFVEGMNKKFKRIFETEKYMDDTKKELNISDKELSKWSDDIETFEFSDGRLQLTIPQRMYLYVLNKRDQAKMHIAFGGVKAEEVKTKNKDYLRQIIPVHLLQSDIVKITDTLTAEQKSLADAMMDYLSNEASGWGNNISRQLYGFDMYTEKNYFPIRTDSNVNATTVSNENPNATTRSLQNSSFTKELTPNANNAVILGDIFDIFTDHVTQMATYEGYVLAINDAMRYFNHNEVNLKQTEIDDMIGNYRTDNSIKKEIDRVLGSQGKQYFVRFIQDVNGDGRVANDLGFFNDLVSKNKAQAVMANARVIIQQPTAYVRALMEMDNKYLMRAATLNPVKLKKYAEKSKKQVPLANWKSKGYYETSVGQSLKSIITGSATNIEKINEIAGAGAGMADDITWGMLYRASELQASDELNTDVESKEYRDRVNDIFTNIIIKTQVVDTTLTKSQVMRNKDTGHKLMTAFMAEPTKSYNMLHRAWFEGRQTGNFNKFKRAALVFAYSNILVSIAQSIVDAWRDNEEDEEYYKRFLNAWLGIDDIAKGENAWEKLKGLVGANLFDTLNPLNLVPVLNQISSAIQGFDNSNMGTDAIFGITNLIEKTIGYMNGQTKLQPYGLAYESAKVVSMCTGVPIASAMREVKDIYNNVNNIWDGKNLVKYEQKTNKYKFIGDKDNITDNVTVMYDEKVTELMNNGKSEKEAKSSAKSTIASGITSNYKQQLIDLKNEDIQQANELKQNLLEAYVAIGYSRDKANDKINKWFE